MGCGASTSPNGEIKLGLSTSVVPGMSPGISKMDQSHGNGEQAGGTSVEAWQAMIRVQPLENFPPPIIKPEDVNLVPTTDVLALLEKNSWDTNVFEFTGDDGVLILEAIYEELGLIKEFNIDSAKLRTFLLTVRQYYHSECSYHNFYHCLDVTLGVWWLLKNTLASTILNRLDIFALITSAIGHDIDHPGTTNSFQVNIKSRISLVHNNKSVLENHHLNVLLSILRVPEADIFSGLSAGSHSSVMNVVVENVLATDIMRHFELSGQISTKIGSGSPFSAERQDDHRLIMMALLKMADISNSSKQFEVAAKWATNVLEEFWRQGDIEKAMGGNVSPLCDRDSTDFDLSQVNFIKFLVGPFYKQCQEIPLFDGIEGIVSQLNHNAQIWQAKVDKKIAVKTFQAVNQETRQTLLQELFLGQILFMSQDLTDAGVVDMCNSFMESSSSIKMSVLGHDIQEFLDVVHMACSCETVTLYWQNVYNTNVYEIVGSVGQGMPTSAILVDKNVKSVTRKVFESQLAPIWNNSVPFDEDYNWDEDGRLTESIMVIPMADAVQHEGSTAKGSDEPPRGFLQMRNKLDYGVEARGSTSNSAVFEHVAFNDEDISMTSFLVEQSQAKIQSKVEEKFMVDQIDHVLRHDSDTNNAAATLEIVGVFMEKARDLIGAGRCSLFLVDDIRGELCTAYATKTDERRMSKQTSTDSIALPEEDDDDDPMAPPKHKAGQKLVIRIPLGKGLVGSCADTGKDILIPDCQTDPRFDKASDKRNNYQTKTCLCVPIKNSVGEVLGVVQMLNKMRNDEVVAFTEEDSRKIRGVSSKATVAIEKAQLFAKLQLVMDATCKINASSVDLDALVAKTMSCARRLLNADRCTLFMYEAGSNQLYSRIMDEDHHQQEALSQNEQVDFARRASTASLSDPLSKGSKPEVMKRKDAKIMFDATKGIAGKVIKTKQVINCIDVYEDPGFNRQIDEQTGYRTKSLLCVPVLNSSGEILGVSQMVNKLNRHGDTIPFSDQDEKLMRAFVSQVAVAMTNSHIFAHTFGMLSQTLSILSSLPDVVIAIGTDGGFLECNRPVQQALRVKDDDSSLHLHYSEWLKPVVPKELYDVVDRAVTGGEEFHIMFSDPVVVGGYTYTGLHANPLSNSKVGGTLVCLRCSHQPDRPDFDDSKDVSENVRERIQRQAGSGAPKKHQAAHQEDGKIAVKRSMSNLSAFSSNMDSSSRRSILLDVEEEEGALGVPPAGIILNEVTSDTPDSLHALENDAGDEPTAELRLPTVVNDPPGVGQPPVNDGSCQGSAVENGALEELYVEDEALTVGDEALTVGDEAKIERAEDVTVDKINNS